MTSFRYEPSALAADYARSGAGVAIAGGLLVGASPLPFISVVLGAATALFAVYGLRTGLRHITELQVDETGIRVCGPWVGAFDREVPWVGITGMKLSYYSTQRDRKKGWMQLRVRGGGSTIRCDSAVSEFPQIVEYAYRAACDAGVELGPSTVINLKSMGLARDVEPPL